MVWCVLRGFLFVLACAFLWWGRWMIGVFQEEILIRSGISALACVWEEISALAVCLLKYLILHYQTHCNACIKFSREYTEGVQSAQTMDKAWKKSNWTHILQDIIVLREETNLGKAISSAFIALSSGPVPVLPAPELTSSVHHDILDHSDWHTNTEQLPHTNPVAYL